LQFSWNACIHSKPQNKLLDEIYFKEASVMPLIKTVLGVLYVLLTLSILACGGPTGYTKRDAWNPHYGYSDKRIDNDEFSIVVRGNPLTSKERIAQIALLRAAHVTQEEGRTHFYILKQKTEVLDTEKLISIQVFLGGIFVPVPVKTKASEEPTAILLIRILPIQSSYPSGALSASEIIDRLSKYFSN